MFSEVTIRQAIDLYMSIPNCILMSKKDNSTLCVPRENMVFSGCDSLGKKGVISPFAYSLVTFGGADFGILVREGSPSEVFMEHGSFCMNIIPETVYFPNEERILSFDEVGLTPTTMADTIATAESVLSIYAVPEKRINTGMYVMYVCKIRDVQRYSKETLKHKLKQLGIFAPQLRT